MAGIFEGIMHIILRERLLRRFEKKVLKGETAAIDLFLRKGTHYIVRAKVAKGHGTPMLSLGEATGFSVPTWRRGKGNSFSVILERGGLYRIRTGVRPLPAEGEPVTVAVTLSSAIPAPQYVMYQIIASSCGFTRPSFTKDSLTEDLPEGERPLYKIGGERH
jgi:hypothetical protein